jgi:hypothetical protein
VVVTFLAMLELVRLRQIIAVQNATFGDIEIARAPNSSGSPLPPDHVLPDGAGVAVNNNSTLPNLNEHGA